jgi:kynurenine formamidase
VGFADERVEMDLHIGTHLDALGHCWIGDQGFNQMRVLDVVDDKGLAQLGIERVPPLVTRGVLLDVVHVRGRPLEAGEVITPADLEAAVRRQSCIIEPGDIALIRSGWGRHYGQDNALYAGAAPGIGVDAATWLANQQVCVVGGDTMTLEVYPPEAASSPWAVHQFLLATRGTYILENAYLEAIASSGQYSFLCACLPIKFRGGTASPVRLVAVV